MPASNKVCKSNNVHASMEPIADVSLQEKKEKAWDKSSIINLLTWLVQININNHHVSLYLSFNVKLVWLCCSQQRK